MSHSHSKHENRTCHWGFDSANWAAYIQVFIQIRRRNHLIIIQNKRHFYHIFLFKVFEDYSEEEIEKYKEELESIKKRFSHPKMKRKWVRES